MAKRKIIKTPIVKNKYAHNLSEHTIVVDANSFEVSNRRYLILIMPDRESNGLIVNIKTKERYPIDYKRLKKVFN